jgi:hypothetical protein
MSCHEVQTRLSLYLYGELDFAQEEELERHLSGCAFCQAALTREKTWHTNLNAMQQDVPLDLLAECRQGLRSALAEEKAEGKQSTGRSWWSRWEWPSFLAVAPSRWSAQLALGSFLVFVGFGAARLLDRYSPAKGIFAGTEAGVLGGSPSVRIRDIQSNPQGGVHIYFDQVRRQEITGTAADPQVRELLLAGALNSADPSLRLDSVDMLGRQDGTDVRDALLQSVQHDSSAAVRLKALESLRRFSDDPETRTVLKSVLAKDSDAQVRAAAIDVFAPANETPRLSPDVEPLLRSLAQSEQDVYLRARAMELLRAMNAPLDVY